MLAHDIIIRPIMTEKALAGIGEKKYTFRVDRNCNKIEVANAIEKIFKVQVKKVWTINVRGRMRRRGRTTGYTAAWKKAIVQLKEDSKGIEFFDSMM